MDGPVSWVLELAVKPGQLEPFRALMSEMVAATRADSGALSYEWFVSHDGGVVLIYERYADSAATVRHLRMFSQQFAERFLAAVEQTRFTVMGTPSDEVRAALSEAAPTYLRPFGGFAR
jgi:quinol monooxygenase YgiN